VDGDRFARFVGEDLRLGCHDRRRHQLHLI
jgi:hypothetical protein